MYGSINKGIDRNKINKKYLNQRHHGVDFENGSRWYWQDRTWILAWLEVCRAYKQMEQKSGERF